MCARGMPRSPTQNAPQQPARTGGPLGRERVPAPERVLLPADRPPGPGLDRRDVQRQVLPVQRIAHLGAQRVAGTQSGRSTAEPGHGRRSARPTPRARRPRPGRARSRARRCSRCGRCARRSRPASGRRSPCSRGRSPGSRPMAGERVHRLRPLHGDDRELLVLVGDLDPVRCGRPQPADDLAGVGRVGDEEDLVVATRYAIRSSTVPPDSSQHSVYCAAPGAIRSRSLVRQRLRKSLADSPARRSPTGPERWPCPGGTRRTARPPSARLCVRRSRRRRWPSTRSASTSRRSRPSWPRGQRAVRAEGTAVARSPAKPTAAGAGPFADRAASAARSAALDARSGTSPCGDG